MDPGTVIAIVALALAASAFFGAVLLERRVRRVEQHLGMDEVVG